MFNFKVLKCKLVYVGMTIIYSYFFKPMDFLNKNMEANFIVTSYSLFFISKKKLKSLILLYSLSIVTEQESPKASGLKQ